MSSNLTPMERDRRATMAAEGRSVDETATGEAQTRLWLWIMVGILALFNLAAGGVAGFLGGRFYEQSHRVDPVPVDTYRLLGADLTDAADGGVAVALVYPAGPAELAGLSEGDRLRRIDGQRVDSAAAGRDALAAYGVGDTVSLEIEHHYLVSQVLVTLGVYGEKTVIVPTVVVVTPEPPPPVGTLSEGRLGVYYRMLKPEDRFAVSDGALIISTLASGTPAESAGLQAGDIITQVGSERLSTALTLGDALARYEAGDQVTLMINRAGAAFSVTVQLGGG